MWFFKVIDVIIAVYGFYKASQGATKLTQATHKINNSKEKYDKACRALEENAQALKEDVEKYARVQCESLSLIQNIKEIDPNILSGIEVVNKPLDFDDTSVQNRLKLIMGKSTVIILANSVKAAPHLIYLLSRKKSPTGIMIVGPTIGEVGSVLYEEGEKALTDAELYCSKVEIEIDKFKTANIYLDSVVLRLEELRTILEILNTKVSSALEDIKSLSSDELESANSNHKKVYERAEILISALLATVNAPVLNNDGELNADVAVIIEKYKSITL